MSERPLYYIGDDPNGYGGPMEVSQEQATAYAEAIAAELRLHSPELEVKIGMTDAGLVSNYNHLKAAGWVQANWRRIRAEVNVARGWEEQIGGTLLVDTSRKF